MSENLAIAAEASAEAGPEVFGGRLPLFDQIAQGFLKTLANRNGKGGIPCCAKYLDGKEKIDGTQYSRRLVVLAVEDLKQKLEAPQPLCRWAAAEMTRLRLDPIPKLTFYRDLATALLRMDAAMQLSRVGRAGWQPVYH